MLIETIKLQQFRNYLQTEFIFKEGLTHIIGGNGKGKTNLIEAIQILSSLKSLKTNQLTESISLGHNKSTLFGRIKNVKIINSVS